MSLKESWYRWFYDLANQLVLILCGSLLLFLGIYLFNDFIHEQVILVSQEMSLDIEEWFALIVLMIGSFLAGKALQKELTSSDSLQNVVQRLGEEKKIVTAFKILRFVHFLLVFYLPAGLIVYFFFSDTLSYKKGFLVYIGLIALTVTKARRGLRGNCAASSPLKRSWVNFALSSKLFTMVFWRLRQIFFLHRDIKYSVLSASLFSLLIIPCTSIYSSNILCWLLSFLAGAFGARALCLQFTEDMTCIRIEKHLGINEPLYFKTIHITAFFLGLWLGILSGGSALFASAMRHESFSIQEPLSYLFTSLSVCTLVPSMIFQLDSKKPELTFLCCSFCGIFLGTAIYASLWSILLIPVISYYGIVSQKGRFYRG